MNARAEEFNDSDLSSTNQVKIIFDANNGTALSHNELLSVQEFSGPRRLWFYESNAPTIERIVLEKGVSVVLGSVPLSNATSIPTLRHRPFQRRDVEHFNFIVRPARRWDSRLFFATSVDSEASTLPTDPPVQELDWFACLAGFEDDEIEDGMTAALEEKISNLIRLHGSQAIRRLKELIISNALSPSIASHTLRWLGRIKDSASYDSRLQLLCEGLRSKSPTIRDGASLGLAALGSPKAIPYLEKAIRQEKLPGLRDDMAQVLTELQH